MKKIRIALAQINTVLGDTEKNLKKHIQYCDKAIRQKADIIIFPELSLTGYALKDLNFELALNPYKSPKLDSLRNKSKKIDIICGGCEDSENGGVYNSAFYFSKGETVSVHRKIYPPDYGMFEELRYFSKGRELKVFNTKAGETGMLVCEDLWHISLPLLLALKGAKIIITIAVSPTRLEINPPKNKKDSVKNYEINSEHHKAYARLLSCFIIFCNRVGYEDGVNYWGGSEIVDPFGNVLCKAKFFDEDLVYADINMEEVKHARRQSRHFLDEDINFLKNEIGIMNEEIKKIK